MKLMKRGTRYEYVPDIFVEAFKDNGYEVVGEEATENVASDPFDADTNPKTSKPKKKPGS